MVDFFHMMMACSYCKADCVIICQMIMQKKLERRRRKREEREIEESESHKEQVPPSEPAPMDKSPSPKSPMISPHQKYSPASKPPPNEASNHVSKNGQPPRYQGKKMYRFIA